MTEQYPTEAELSQFESWVTGLDLNSNGMTAKLLRATRDRNRLAERVKELEAKIRELESQVDWCRVQHTERTW